MTNSSQQEHFKSLRKRYPNFYYRKYSSKNVDGVLVCSFHFSINDEYEFQPEISIPLPENYNLKGNETNISALVFHIGMVELISYWKSTCSPNVFIECGSLNAEQINWFKKLYFNGLGEFFYRNEILTGIEEFISIETRGELVQIKNESSTKSSSTSNKILVPIGGGKDSVVSLELLSEEGYEIIPFSVNPNPAVERSIISAGYKLNSSIFPKRKLDPELFKLNAKGYLNGHTPFSALLAFTSYLTAYLFEIKDIALSNESSASEPNVKDSNVNHQYSKSIEFERDFREYIDKYINLGPLYFSFLRPLNELQIAKLFSLFTRHHSGFRSCNVGSKNDEWCTNCSKCLFTFIMISPFLPLKEMIQIYGEDLLDKSELMNDFEQLCGIQDVKPFDCVGTRDEVRAALDKICIQRKQNDQAMPILLRHYCKYNEVSENGFQELMNEWNEEHFLSPELESIINKSLKKV